MEKTGMNKWNKLQALLDAIFGHNVKHSSRISKRIQGFDNQTGEHMIVIEYRVKMMNEDSHATRFPTLARYAGLLERRI